MRRSIGFIRGNANGTNSLVVGKNVTGIILEDGLVVDLTNRSFILNKTEENLEFRLAKSYITQEDFERRIAFAREHSIKYDVTVPVTETKQGVSTNF